MNEKSQQKDVVPGKSEDVVKDLIYLTLDDGVNDGVVVVRGAHLVSQKMLGILSEVLKRANGDKFGVFSVMFRDDDHPKGVLGMAHPDTGSIAINLEEIWVLSTMILEEGEKHLSLLGLIWENLLMTLVHEIHHIGASMDPIGREELEKDHAAADKSAEEWAREVRNDLAKGFDIEPPALADIPFFGSRMMELMTTKAEEEWVSEAAALVSDGIIYQDLKNDERISTYREYVRGLVDPKLEDKSWDQGFSAIDFAFEMEGGSTTVIEEPKTKVQALEVVEESNVDFQNRFSKEMETAPLPDEALVDALEAVEVAAVNADLAADAAMGEAGETVIADEEPAASEQVVNVEATAVEALLQPGPEIGVEVPGGAVAAVAVQPAATTQAQPATAAPQADEDYAAVMGDEAEGDQAAVDEATATDFTDTVDLPEHILAEQAQVRNAATATPQTFQPKTPLTPVNMTSEQLVAFLQAVYMRLYSNIFNKCGRILNNDQAFENPGAVLDAVSLADLIKIHNAQGLIVSYETVNELKMKAFEDFVGHVRGTVFAKSNPYGLPAYVLYLNLGGVVAKRSLVPQNPAKINTNSGQLSTTALEARQGHSIIWIMSDDPANKFIAQIRDNTYRVL